MRETYKVHVLKKGATVEDQFTSNCWSGVWRCKPKPGFHYDWRQHDFVPNKKLFTTPSNTIEYRGLPPAPPPDRITKEPKWFRIFYNIMFGIFCLGMITMFAILIYHKLTHP